MPAVSMSSSRRPVSSTSTKPAPRRTRWSVIKGALIAPYEVDLAFGMADGIVHSFGHVVQGDAWDSCCRIQLAGITRVDAEAPTCVACVLCKGCHACRPNHICAETMAMGKWETKDGRRLYPFEMDPIHLVNAIKKLKRDQHHFKDNWEDWVKVLGAEAALRKIAV